MEEGPSYRDHLHSRRYNMSAGVGIVANRIDKLAYWSIFRPSEAGQERH